jgi:hypothetical protein
MGLISVRVAHGESIIPASRRGRRQRGRARRFIANMSMDSVADGAQDGKDITRERGNLAAESGPEQSVKSMRQEANEKEAVAAEERAATKGDTRATTSEEVGAQQATEPKLGALDRLKNQWEASKVDLLGGGVSVCAVPTSFRH